MINSFLYQAERLFRKALWLFVFISFLSLNDFPTTNIYAGLCEILSLTSTDWQQEISKQTDQNKTVPFSNSNDEKSDSDCRTKGVDEKIYSKNKRIVADKKNLAFTDLSYAVIFNILKDDFPFPYISDFSNTCFASLYKFSVF